MRKALLDLLAEIEEAESAGLLEGLDALKAAAQKARKAVSKV